MPPVKESVGATGVTLYSAQTPLATLLAIRVAGPAVKLTTARYFTPSGRSIQAEGIKPDIALQPLKVKDDADPADAFDPLSEADLSKHLSNPNQKTDQASDKPVEAPKPEVTPEPAPTTPDTKEGADKDQGTTDKAADKGKKTLAEEDYQLFEALNILKGMDLVQSRVTSAPAATPTPAATAPTPTQPAPAAPEQPKP